MINIERQKENFKDHIATLTEYENIKILDFKNPKSNTYRIRFLFEEDYYRLHISGDLGELIASNYCNMTYEKFFDFVNDIGYFEHKIDCHSRSIYSYDVADAKEDIKRIFDEYEVYENILIDEQYEWENKDEFIDRILDNILEDYSSDRGLGSMGYDKLSKYLDDVWEFAGNIGKRDTGILDLYMLAFKMATEQLKEHKNNE